MSFYSDIWGCNFIWPVRFSWWWCSVAKSDSLWPHGLPACQASLSFTVCQSCLKLMSIESVMPSNHLILCRPLLLPPSIFSSIRVFSKESALHIRWPKDWSSASASVLPVNIQDWFPLGLTGLIFLLSSPIPQFKSINSAFFIVQLSHPYMTIGKTIALTRWTFVRAF